MKEILQRGILKFLEAIPLALRAAMLEAAMLGVWAVDARHRRVARINLKIAFPEMGDREAKRIIRLCYKRMGTSVAEFIHLPKVDERYIEKHIRVEGVEHLRRTVDLLGRGPFGMTGHFGNWELMSHVLSIVYRPVTFIVRPLKSAAMDRIVTERRELRGNRVIRKEDSAKLVMREIRSRTMVGILIDQNVDAHKGVPVDFFTRKAYTTFGLARLALALQAPVHPAFIFRNPRRKFDHTVRFGPPLPMDPEAPREEEVARLTRRFNEELEKAIREDPTQWLWMHRRWRTRPPGEPDVYGEDA